jgi:hypothetical protein
MRRTAAAVAVATLAVVGSVVGAAVAHPLEPSSLDIDETTPGVAAARMRTPAAASVTPVWPAICVAELRSREHDGDAAVDRFALDCGGRSLSGAELGVDGLAVHDTIALVRVRLADGQVVRDVLGPSRPRFTVPAATAWPDVVASYARLGIDHLLGGLDHVLFVLGLVFIVRGLRARAVTLTAFTAGHGVTLMVAVAGVVRVPAAPVEVLIALTLIAVAVEVGDPSGRRGAGRSWALAAAFGLIHGLGFAGALSGAGLDDGELWLALAGFHLGIELGQLVVVGGAAAVAAIAARSIPRPAAAAQLTRRIAAYAIGGLAAMWCLERTWGAIAG